MNLEKYMLPCISKTLFGIECLGCGFQRAFLLVLEGNFEAAFKMYPAIYSCLIFILFIGLHFADSKRDYKKALLVLAILNGSIMIVSYYYKHFL
ncbi:DUF2752 domain-containing protein [Flavobacterium sp. N2013]|uniref:DUF2752 domain-containing protein n=2 Tax=Flavobacterium keumense TaxID=1306518 RepID=A0ABY8N389_9FLAO|nr:MULTISPECIES: DUF2752 domain-containing protein [Flavobacterium]WGK93844.1 DUF2752 domain-containing protein [Flavobacterium keumense]